MVKPITEVRIIPWWSGRFRAKGDVEEVSLAAMTSNASRPTSHTWHPASSRFLGFSVLSKYGTVR
jgi:hypothetical protein